MITTVIPLFNEQDSVEILYQRLIRVLKDVNQEYEIIFVDDGSTDNSLGILKKLAEKAPHIGIFSFRKNQGKSDALMLGFQKAQGDIIVTLDADLQDRPEEIQKLLAKMAKGYDVVSGWRKERQDRKNMVFVSKIFNSIVGKLWGLQLHDFNCGLKVFTKEAAKSLRLYGGLHRFIPVLAYQEGFRVGEEQVLHDKRGFGKSKYGFSKIWKDLPDLFTMFFLTRFGKRPLHFFGFIGIILFFIGVLFLGYLAYLHYFLNEKVGTRPLWSVGILFTLVGLQIIFTGFLADLMINTIQKNKNMNDYRESFLKYSKDNISNVSVSD